MRLIFCIFFLIGTAFVPAALQASLLQRSCSTDLDLAVELYSSGNTSAAQTQFEQLAKLCSHLPQVHHNLGVLAADSKNWPSAVQHFHQAIADDSRTSMTLSHIQNIHQYRASIAYQNALDVKTTLVKPQFQMQNSAHSNKSVKAPSQTTLHNIPTVEYELYSWWLAAATGEKSTWLEHYTFGYPPSDNSDANEVGWNRVDRDISFTAQDAVVVLSYRKDNLEKRTLLLLRLENNRWKIYREALL